MNLLVACHFMSKVVPLIHLGSESNAAGQGNKTQKIGAAQASFVDQSAVPPWVCQSSSNLERNLGGQQDVTPVKRTADRASTLKIKSQLEWRVFFHLMGTIEADCRLGSMPGEWA